MSQIHYHVITEGLAATDPLIFRSKQAAERYLANELREDLDDGLVRAEIVPCRKSCIREELAR